MKVDAWKGFAAVLDFFGETPTSSSCRAACHAVAQLYPSQVCIPSSSAFSKAQRSYWNAPQQDVVPACFFQPTSAEQVQRAIVEVVQADCPFSIKAGGHSSNVEGSSIKNGFQFDLAKLKSIDVSPDKSSVKLGPGGNWGSVFQFLEAQGLMALGGRDSGVGLTGFTFGGGISYYATQRGWASDHLISTELVLADGSLITVDSSSHPDLAIALRGGGAHNFGIAISATVKLFPYSGMWGGFYVITEDQFDSFFNAYDVFTQKQAEDGKAHILVDFARVNGTVIALQSFTYPEPTKDPAVFDGFRQIPAAMDTLRLANYSELATEMAEITDSRGRRNTYWTRTFKYGNALLKDIYGIWRPINEAYEDRFLVAFDIQLITPQMRTGAAMAGNPNVLGLEDSTELLQLVVFAVIWDDEADDTEAMSVMRQLDVGVDILLKKHNKHRDFKYMNYGNKEQDVIGSYGAENKEFLKTVAAKYDPSGVFQRLQPGGFKLDGPRSSEPALDSAKEEL